MNSAMMSTVTAMTTTIPHASQNQEKTSIVVSMNFTQSKPAPSGSSEIIGISAGCGSTVAGGKGVASSPPPLTKVAVGEGCADGTVDGAGVTVGCSGGNVGGIVGEGCSGGVVGGTVGDSTGD